MPAQSQPPMVFASGVMLGVLRAATGYNVHGDATFTVDHQIGPCSIAWATNKEARGHEHRDTRDRTLLDIVVPTGQDVRKDDRLQLAAGVLADTTHPVTLHVVGEPEHPVNPFTGWQPFIHVYATVFS